MNIKMCTIGRGIGKCKHVEYSDPWLLERRRERLAMGVEIVGSVLALVVTLVLFRLFVEVLV